MAISEDQLVRILLHEQAKICGLIRLIVRDAGAVEDLFQDVSVKAVKHRAQLADEAHAAHWLRTVARHESINWAKRHARSPLTFDDRILDRVEAEFTRLDAVSSSDVGAALQRCLARLTPYAARIIRLRYVESLTGPALAEAAERNLDATYKALGRAHQGLARCITEQLAAEGADR